MKKIKFLFKPITLFVAFFSLLQSCHNKNEELLIIYHQNSKGELRRLVTSDEIDKYIWSEHRIFVRPDHNESILNIKINDGDVFKMVFERDTIIEGDFVYVALSSFDISTPIIYTAGGFLHLEPETNSFRIYDYNKKNRTPHINHSALMKFLKHNNKLY